MTVCSPLGESFKKEYVPQIIYLCSIYELQKFYSEFSEHKYYKNVKNNGLSFDRAMWYNMLIHRQSAVVGNGGC